MHVVIGDAIPTIIPTFIKTKEYDGTTI